MQASTSAIQANVSELLRVKNLSVKRDSTLVLDQLDFTLRREWITGLTGPNGGGKSTLFETLEGLHRPTSGSMEWNGRVEIASVPQHLTIPEMLPLSVREFVSMGEWARNRKSSPALQLEEAIQELKLGPIASKLVGHLSGGEWRRSVLARALVQPADLYLLDEPFNHVDLETEEAIGHLLRRLVSDKKKTFFVISHDWSAMDHHFDWLILLNKRIIAEGRVRDVSQVAINWKDPSHHHWMHAE